MCVISNYVPKTESICLWNLSFFAQGDLASAAAGMKQCGRLVLAHGSKDLGFYDSTE